MVNKIKDKIIKISDNILNILLEFREQNPDFTFSLRQRDSVRSKDKRLENGFWFQGSNYIYVPLFKKGDNARKLKTLGFVIGFSKDGENHNNYIEISFKVGSNDNEKAFHKELADYFNIELDKNNVGYYRFPSNDYENNINFYLNDFRIKALELLDKYSSKSQFVITEDQFKKALIKIITIRENLKSSSSQEKMNVIEPDIIQRNNIKLPLNHILYGPPGTGKTHKLLNEYYSHFEVQNKTITKEEFEFEIITKLSWWQVFALILLENKSSTVPDIKKHRFVDYKLQVSNTKSLSQTVWGQLSAHTIEDSATVQYNKRTEPLIFNKSTSSVWEIVNEKKELIDELLELSQKIRDYKGKVVTSKNYKFITFHQSFSYEDFIEGIKPTLDKELSEDSTEVSYVLKKGTFYQCCDEAAKLAGFLNLKDSIENYTKEERVAKFENASPYGLFIDEINRGNISQIFGELITVIEDTKRLGKDEVIVELPYSKDKFGVPSNLYIIGTMNTADRSIEALDTALRRRFCFEEMTSKENLLSPSAMYCRLLWKYEKVGWDDPEFVENESNLFNLLRVSEQWHSEKVEIWDKMTKAEDKNLDDYFSEFSITGINLQSLLEKINERIEILLNRDHKIGHSYFIDVNCIDDLRSVFKNSIVPLLQEYFYGDYEKIGWILGEGFFVERKMDKNGVFTKFFKQPKPEFELEYKLADLDEIKIEIAVQKLLGTYKETTSTIEN